MQNNPSRVNLPQPVPAPSTRNPGALYIHDTELPTPAKPGLPAPTGAPNVLIILLDDMGFGASTAFGGPCEMPTAERLAGGGAKFSRFHVNAMCSPTRQSLLTGRNSHAVGMGAICELSTTAPGYTGVRPDSAATLAQVLLANGFNTAAFGKMHQTPMWEVSPAGPFDRWPTGEGFEKFYGFVGPEMNHWDPLLYDGTYPVEPNKDHDPSYHLSEDLADQAVRWLDMQRALGPNKPFFLYMSMGGTHAPLHVPDSWREKYRGAFAKGWDALREQTLARQKAMGIVPEEAVLSPWPDGLPHWDELSPEAKRVAEVYMETYAAMAEHTDAQIGKVVDALQDSGQLDNTLIFYILGDNGASGEGSVNGTLNADRSYSGIDDEIDYLVEHLDEVGGPKSYPLYPAGWAVATCTPYQYTKQVASHFGGTRDGMVVHWPAGLKAHGQHRHQWHHVTDLYPTVLEAVGVPAPESFAGVAQQPVDGTSMLYTFEDPDAADRRLTQYFETMGNRAIYHDGWIASVKHRTPWSTAAKPDMRTEEWQLYDLTNDWSQAIDVAEQNPDKLARLKELFMIEAARNSVLPIDDRGFERMSPQLAPRPARDNGGEEMILKHGMTRIYEDAAINLKNCTHRVAATVEVGADGGEGVIVAQGGRFGGWALHIVEGRPVYTYNYFGLWTVDVEAADRLKPGTHVIEMRFDYRGSGMGGNAELALWVDGTPESSGSLAETMPLVFSSHETLDVATDLGTPVSSRYDDMAPDFNGRVVEVKLSVSDRAPDDAERRLNHRIAQQ
ncbi:arylsulfatase [Mycolicibacterium wolinskyi]|uniref:arylsulfatase n=1 Tax=Mycolicibacterium wolinskyi TaxID=59750 RepID=UPI0039176817